MANQSKCTRNLCPCVQFMHTVTYSQAPVEPGEICICNHSYQEHTCGLPPRGGCCPTACLGPFQSVRFNACCGNCGPDFIFQGIPVLTGSTPCTRCGAQYMEHVILDNRTMPPALPMVQAPHQQRVTPAQAACTTPSPTTNTGQMSGSFGDLIVPPPARIGSYRGISGSSGSQRCQISNTRSRGTTLDIYVYPFPVCIHVDSQNYLNKVKLSQQALAADSGLEHRYPNLGTTTPKLEFELETFLCMLNILFNAGLHFQATASAAPAADPTPEAIEAAVDHALQTYLPSGITFPASFSTSLVSVGNYQWRPLTAQIRKSKVQFVPAARLGSVMINGEKKKQRKATSAVPCPPTTKEDEVFILICMFLGL